MSNESTHRFFNIADCVNSDDPQGRTYRQINAEKVHNIPIGALVEVNHGPDDSSPSDGVRLFVVHHGRDCDQTPLYELCHDPEDITQENPRFRNNKWIGGYSEDSLTVIRLPVLNPTQTE